MNEPVNFLGKHKKKKKSQQLKTQSSVLLHLCNSKKIWNVQIVSEKVFLLYVTELLEMPCFYNNS